ncbi:hypothetical protein BJ508DRAFT_320864 [Ascobolus immersus RN42]|uniref:DUF2415 domain-containing protein n=1 Tax=Ascobolus immersus RN42 TaxID=1160509 RepID=A0A3N4IT24_ASCIM|nr:hypothetical protein BJ508DRAFT_320864 [Ascobolus immersus RN42]
MTIDCTPTVPFINKSEILHYPAYIPWKHWQLRSLITAPSSETIYYPSGFNVFMLNTADSHREHVTTLAFEPRCIGAKYGWLCVGGHQGQVAAMQVDEYERQAKWATRLRKRQEEEAAQIESEEEREAWRQMHPEFSVGPIEPETAEFGDQITNSITLHNLENGRADGSDVVLAVLTNNDMTVRIVDLANNMQKVKEFKLPYATNHASISPDGRYLVVVGDTPKVFFYKLNLASADAPNEPPKIYRTGTDSHMSTAFSPSSQQCAVACQDGTITIFDVNKIDSGQGAIVKKLQSRRPGHGSGAIRSVQFSPAPWDLLVWAEHCGRISIADTRSNYEWQETIEVLVDDKAVRKKDVDEIRGRSEADLANNRNSQSYGVGGQASRRIQIPYYRMVDESDPLRHGLEGYNLGWGESEGGELDESHPYVYRASLHPYRTGSTTFAMFPAPQTAAAVNGIPLQQQSLLPHIHPSSVLLVNPVSAQQATRFGVSNQVISSPYYTVQPVTSQYVRQSLQRPTSLRTGIPPPAPSAPHSAAVSRQPSRRDMRPSGSGSGTTSNTNDQDRQADGTDSSRAPLSANPDFNRLISGEGRRQRALGAETTASSRDRRRMAFDTHGDYDGRHSTSRAGGVDGELDVNGCTFSCDGTRLYVATVKGLLEYKINTQGRLYFPQISFR